MYFESHNCLFVFAVIIVLAILGIFMYTCYISENFTNMLKLQEHFSPTGWTRNCPQPNPRAVGTSVAYGPLTGPLGRKFNKKTGKFEKVYKPFGIQSDSIIRGKSNISKGNVIGTCGPGCVYKCKNRKDCPNLVKGCAPKERIPNYPNNLPLGWGSTVSGPYAGESGCASNINGINKMSFETPYGSTFKLSPNGKHLPSGNQMYGVCTKGSMNPFDKPAYPHLV